MLNRTIAKNSRMLKKNIYILFTPFLFSFLFSLFLLFYFSISALSSLRTQTPSLLSLPSLVVVFGCDSCGFWLCPELKRGCGSWLGPLWVVGYGSAWLWVSGGCGSAWLWVVDRRGCGLWVVDRRGWVVVVDRRAEVGRGRGSAAEGGRWSWIGG